MRIAIMAPLGTAIREPYVGGALAFVADLARGLTERGHDVDVYAATGSMIFGAEVIDTGVDPGSPAPERAFASGYETMSAIEYDVVHNHAFDAPAIHAAAGLPMPVVHTLRRPPDELVAPALRAVVAAGRPPAVATVSRFQADVWRRVVPVDAVLPPYPDTGSIGWSAQAGRGLVFAGRLCPEKGAAAAIDIARAAGLPIDVYGDASDPEYARDQIEPRRAWPGVAVHGGVPRPSLWEIMASAAVVLCPAGWDEPFGMTAAEAQACGTPVVAFRRGGLAEVIEDGVTGYLVPPGDIAAAAAAVSRAAGLSRQACREHAEVRLDLELSLDAHEELYQRLRG